MTVAQRYRLDACEYFRGFMARHVAQDNLHPGRVSIGNLTSLYEWRSIREHLTGRQQPELESLIEYSNVLYGAVSDSVPALESKQYPWCHLFTLLFASGRRLGAFVSGIMEFAWNAGTVERYMQTWHLVHSMPFLCDAVEDDDDVRLVKAYVATDGGDLNAEQLRLIDEYFQDRYAHHPKSLLAEFTKTIQFREWAKVDVSLNPEERSEVQEIVERNRFVLAPDIRAIWLLAERSDLSLRARQISICRLLCCRLWEEINEQGRSVSSRYMKAVWPKIRSPLR